RRRGCRWSAGSSLLPRQRAHEVRKIGAGQVGLLSLAAMAGVLVLDERGAAAGAAAALDVGVGVAGEPRLREIDAVIPRGVLHEIRARLAARAQVLGAVEAVEKLGDRRAAEL